MNGRAVPPRVHRLIFVGIVVYFGLFALSMLTGNQLAEFAAEVVFGVIAIGLGAMLYQQSGGDVSAELGAAVCLFAGGLTQFGALATQSPALMQFSSLAVFAGIGLYIYAVYAA